MASWIRKALVALVFDYLYDELIWFLRSFVEKTGNPIDDAVVNWLDDMRSLFRDQVGI